MINYKIINALIINISKQSLNTRTFTGGDVKGELFTIHKKICDSVLQPVHV
jgi:hypothetical protein